MAKLSYKWISDTLPKGTIEEIAVQILPFRARKCAAVYAMSSGTACPDALAGPRRKARSQAD